MSAPDRRGWDAAAWTAAFAEGRAEPPDLLEACLARIRRFDAALGICNHVADRAALFDQAADAAARWRDGAPLSPLDGVPFGVKANIAVRGFPWHGGIAAFRDVQASTDADCVQRLRAAGMIPLALLNMHEAALGETTANSAFGTTRNPHDPERIPGGSSGGSAAAVAAGIAPVALGTDSLGSVRLPSALCGVVGFKPAYDRIPLGGVLPLSRRLDHVGVHGRSVADVAAVAGLFEPRRTLGGPAEGAESGRDAPPLARWGVAAGQPAFKAVAAAVDGVLFDGAVARCVDWSDVDLSSVRRAGLLMCERDAAARYAEALRDDPDGFSPAFRRLVAWGAAQPEEKVRRAERLLTDTSQRLRADLEEVLLLGPTTAHLAPRHDGRVPETLANLTAPAAVAGVPAISVPLPAPSGTPPMGLQIAGLDGAQVLSAAKALFPGVAAPVP